MNCPSRVEPDIPPDWNQSPPALAADATTRNDLNHMANARQERDNTANHTADDAVAHRPYQPPDTVPDPTQRRRPGSSKPQVGGSPKADMGVDAVDESHTRDAPKTRASTFNLGYAAHGSAGHGAPRRNGPNFTELLLKARDVLYNYAKFVGPGFMVAVAYIDPGEIWLLACMPCQASRLTCTRKLCYRCCCWCYLPFQAPFHYSDVQHLRHLPAVPLREAGHSHRHESG